ncbi:MAG: sugar transferase [Candidatus Aenigmarchaeota archaeon]|nr:sugar transferase [Candidatus Aenigmarchaeota archaeon]
MSCDFFYTRISLGKSGEPIDVYKIRTMDPNCPPCDIERNHYGKLVVDQRVTKIGRILRKYWIDEIPQFWNLARGDMGIVGVRPMGEEMWRRYPEDIKNEALRYRPGLFGFQYAFTEEGGFDKHVENMRRYLEESDKSPYLTDIKYFFCILWNIIIRGVRSS